MFSQQDVAEKITTVIVESDEDLGNLNYEQEKSSKNEKEFERKTYPIIVIPLIGAGALIY